MFHSVFELIVLVVVIKHKRHSMCICYVTALQTHTIRCLLSIASCIFLWNLKFNTSKITFLHKITSLFWLFFCSVVTTVLIIQTHNKAAPFVASYLFSHSQIIAKFYILLRCFSNLSFLLIPTTNRQVHFFIIISLGWHNRLQSRCSLM